MTKKNVLPYLYTREFTTAIKVVENSVNEKNKAVIESEDLLLAILDTPDTGLSYQFGRSGISKTLILKLLKKAEKKSTKRKEKDVEQIKKESLYQINEKPSNSYFNEDSTTPISKELESILNEANDISKQQDFELGIDTSYLGKIISEHNHSNFYYIIEKILIDKGTIPSSYRTSRPNSYYINFDLDFRIHKDGYKAFTKQFEISSNNQLSNKVLDPTYSAVDEVSINLTEKAREGKIPEVIGREKEIEKIEMTLTRLNKNNVVLLGDGGVGKSAIIEGLANKIVNDENCILADCNIYEFNINDFNIYYDIFIEKLLEEMRAKSNSILFIDEIHRFLSNSKLINKLKPAMARGDFRIIGATTHKEWNINLRGDKALERRFEKIVVEEPSEEDTIKIITKIINKYENHYRANYTEKAIETAVKLSKLYIKQERLPDSALTIIDNAGAQSQKNNFDNKNFKDYTSNLNILSEKLKVAKSKRFNEVEVDSITEQIKKLTDDYYKNKNDNSKNDYENKITENEIKKAIEEKTGIPIKETNSNKDDKIQHIKTVTTNLRKAIVGQDYAIEVIINAVNRSILGIRDKSKPAGIYLFSGPTGVGKTETAKVLAQELFFNKKAFIRFDMSEYQHDHEVSKLIGSPPGYVGSTQGGQLTNAVQENPYSVILFDEIEKAHPNIADIFLQIFDDGILTDSLGNTVDFKNTIIILTTNLGNSTKKDNHSIGFQNDQKQHEDLVMKELQQFFRPELLNRIDEVIRFIPLDLESIYEITELLLEKTVAYIREQEINISYDDEAVKLLSELGYDKNNGARPIKRVITRKIENLLSNMIIDGKLNYGDSCIITTQDNDIVIKKCTATN